MPPLGRSSHQAMTAAAKPTTTTNTKSLSMAPLTRVGAGSDVGEQRGVAGDLPSETAMPIGLTHSAVLSCRPHRRGVVREGSKGAAPDAEDEVLGAEQTATDRVAVRVTEHEQPIGVLGGGLEESLEVGVAAHHPMQDDDVVTFDGVRRGGEVELAANDPLDETGL